MESIRAESLCLKVVDASSSLPSNSIIGRDFVNKHVLPNLLDVRKEFSLQTTKEEVDWMLDFRLMAKGDFLEVGVWDFIGLNCN